MFSVLVVFFIVGCIFCDTLCISLYYNHAVLLVVFFIVGCIFCDTLCISLYYNHAVLLVVFFIVGCIFLYMYFRMEQLQFPMLQ